MSCAILWDINNISAQWPWRGRPGMSDALAADFVSRYPPAYRTHLHKVYCDARRRRQWQGHDDRHGPSEPRAGRDRRRGAVKLVRRLSGPPAAQGNALSDGNAHFWLRIQTRTAMAPSRSRGTPPGAPRAERTRLLPRGARARSADRCAGGFTSLRPAITSRHSGAHSTRVPLWPSLFGAADGLGDALSGRYCGPALLGPVHRGGRENASRAGDGGGASHSWAPDSISSGRAPTFCPACV